MEKNIPFCLTVSFLMNNLFNTIEIYDNAFKLYEQKEWYSKQSSLSLLNIMKVSVDVQRG